MITEQRLKEINALIASLQKQRDEAHNLNAQLMAQIQLLQERNAEEEVKVTPSPKRNGKSKVERKVADG